MLSCIQNGDTSRLRDLLLGPQNHLNEGHLAEKMQDIDSVNALLYTALLDFAERVSQHKTPQGMSYEIYESIQFINQNVNRKIRVDDVARHANLSRSSLNRKFKSELGFDVSRFIMRCKLEEAKRLLTYSDRSLSEISSYLCFSSQAYFQNVFKKQYGITPLNYRNKTIISYK